MSLRPIHPLQAAPLLPLVAAKLRRTPVARLASVCRWVAPLAPAVPPPLFRAEHVFDRQEAIAILADSPVRPVWLRPLGSGLLVDRLACGIAAGTTVALSPTPLGQDSLDVIA